MNFYGQCWILWLLSQKKNAIQSSWRWTVQQACGKAGCEEVSTSVETEYNQIMIQNTRTVSSPARKKHIH